MLSEVFYWVLNISIIGGATGLILLVLRKIKKIPRYAVYLLWLLPLIRFWIPFGIANRYSLMNLISKYGTKTIVIWKNDFQLSTSNTMQAARSYYPIVYKTDLLKNVFHYASIVWVIVSIVAVLSAFSLYYFTKSEMKLATLIRDNIYKSDIITAPAVYGIMKPKIIIPSAVADGEIDYIIMHEQIHVKRKDNLLRMVAVITACIHWFNPLVWICLKYFLADMELACDTKVVKKLDEKRRREYAAAVLNSSAGKAFFASAFGGAKTRTRIENILSYKKLTFLSSISIFALVGAIAITLITNAVG